MSEKITKSWIEKTIHEKAEQKFEYDVADFFRTLNMTSTFIHIQLELKHF